MMKTYHIVEEETSKMIYEIQVPDDVAAKGVDAIYEYWYNIEYDSAACLVETDCRNCEVVDLYEVSKPILGD